MFTTLNFKSYICFTFFLFYYLFHILCFYSAVLFLRFGGCFRGGDLFIFAAVPTCIVVTGLTWKTKNNVGIYHVRTTNASIYFVFLNKLASELSDKNSAAWSNRP